MCCCRLVCEEDKDYFRHMLYGLMGKHGLVDAGSYEDIFVHRCAFACVCVCL